MIFRASAPKPVGSLARCARRCMPTWTGSAHMGPSDPYPRDLIGYGARPPHAGWPRGARVAVSIVLNYEEGGEYCVLHGDAHSESVLTDVGADPLENARNLNAVAEIAESGFEVACHGQRWIDYQSVAEDAERADMLRNVEVITRLIGQRPLGWYTGRPGPNTRRLVVETGGFLYDSDAYNDDLPYWVRVGGRPHLVVPHTFDCNDSRLQRGGDFAAGEDFFTYCRDAFDWLYRLGNEGRPRMMTVSLHARIIGRPGRIGALVRLLDHMQRHEGVWLCKREAIARHWTLHHPA